MKQSMKHLAAALALCLPFAAGAHDVWVVPSSTVLSGADSWITVDAAVGNDKFHFNHAPLRLDGLAVTAPDGSAAGPRTSIEASCAAPSTCSSSRAAPTAWPWSTTACSRAGREDGKPKRYFGKPEGMAQAVPAKADELEVSQSLGRVETFVTAGKPSAVKPVGRGLELAPVTHPNDLYAGETATFQMLLDGQPAPDLEMTIVAGGIRYRDQVGEIKAKTDKDGKFSVKWPQPGLYWVEAGMEDAKVSVPQAKKRRLSYAGTFEVLKP